MMTPWERGAVAFEEGKEIWSNPWAPGGVEKEALAVWERRKAVAWEEGWRAAERRHADARRRLAFFLLAWVLGFLAIVVGSLLAFRNGGGS